jgi:2-polyprenyl-3-methyl-5-hydroxy-6-metoxy-1,4-benzoquinol methylase
MNTKQPITYYPSLITHNSKGQHVAEFNNLYQRAIYYDIVFDRDVSREVQFLKDAFRHHAGRDMGSLLDIACGPGYHARAAARMGLRATGLDLRGEMIQYASDRATEEGLALEWLVADMRSVRLDQPVDMAVAMFDSIDALQTDDDLIAHFQCIADNLTPRGLYVLEISHPGDYHYTQYPRIAYHGERDGVEVDLLWATNRAQFDFVTGVAQVEIEIHVNDHGKQTVIHDQAEERLFCAGEIRLLARLSGKLDVVGWYGDTNLNQPMDHSLKTNRMICVMQKKSD